MPHFKVDDLEKMVLDRLDRRRDKGQSISANPIERLRQATRRQQAVSSKLPPII